MSRHDIDMSYVHIKQCMQTDLIKLYQSEWLTSPVSPLVPDDEVDVDDIYVTSSIRKFENDRVPRRIECPSPVTYKRIFDKDETVPDDDWNSRSYVRERKYIYIIGAAGVGKTTLCHRMVSDWCKAITKRQNNQQLTEDEEVMARYAFVFYIPLRHAAAYVQVDEMIKELLLPNSKYHDIFTTMMQDESDQCLIFLDGLDEWDPPEGSVQMTCFVTQGLPSRRLMCNTTMISTTRPWKLEVLRLRTCEMDYQIKLTGIKDQFSKLLTKQFEVTVSKKHWRESLAAEFSLSHNDSKLSPFRTLPAILQQLVCILLDGQPIGDSQCAIYSTLINQMLELAEHEGERMAGDPDIDEIKKTGSALMLQLPRCFDGKIKCQEYKSMLYSLGRMAFELLFHQNAESAYDFDHCVTELYGMPRTEMDIFLKIGLLSSVKITKHCTSRTAKLSFLHKRFQEFFAALYIAMDSDNLIEHMHILFSICTSVETVLKTGNVFVLVSGMNQDAAGTYSEFIADIAAEDTALTRYRQYTGSLETGSYDMAIGIQSMFMDCITESSDNGHQDIKLKLGDIFIMKHMKTSCVERLVRTNIGQIKSLCIDAPFPLKLLELIVSSGSLQKLVIGSGSGLTMEIAHRLICNTKETLSSLELLIACKPTVNNIPTILSNWESLTALRLKHVKLTHAKMEHLAVVLADSTQLRNIDLTNLWCTQCDFRCTYTLDFSRQTKLEILVLGYLFVDTIHINTTELQRCDVGYLWKQSARTSLIKSLESAPNLEYLSYDDFEVNSIHLLDLQELHFLKCLNLSDIDFESEVLHLSSSMDALNYIRFNNVTMTTEAFIKLVNCVLNMDQSVSVVLCGVCICPDEEASRALDWILTSAKIALLRFSEDRDDLRRTINLDFQTLKKMKKDMCL